MTVPVEQEEYAQWLDWGTRIGLGALAAGFLAYLLEVVEPLVPHAQLPEIWHLPAEEFAALTGASRGWEWAARLAQGEALCMVGVALLALVTLACYLRLVLSYLRGGSRLRASLAAAQVLVLIGAVTGILYGGH